MASRFGLTQQDLAGSQQTAQPEARTDAQGRSTCTNCRTGACNRCPTAITMHGRSGWSSTFDCAHYHADPDEHARLVEADDEEFYENRDDGGRESDRWDSVDGTFNW